MLNGTFATPPRLCDDTFFRSRGFDLDDLGLKVASAHLCLGFPDTPKSRQEHI